MLNTVEDCWEALNCTLHMLAPVSATWAHPERSSLLHRERRQVSILKLLCLVQVLMICPGDWLLFVESLGRKKLLYRLGNARPRWLSARAEDNVHSTSNTQDLNKLVSVPNSLCFQFFFFFLKVRSCSPNKLEFPCGKLKTFN